MAGIIAGSVIGGLTAITLAIWGVWRWRSNRKGEFEDIPQVVSERVDTRAPFFLGTTFGRTRKGAPLDDDSDLEAAPYSYGTSEYTTETLPSSEYMQSTTTYPSLPSETNASLQNSGSTSDTKQPSRLQLSSIDEGQPSAVESSPEEESRSTGEAAFWRREAEVLRQELEELARLPGDLPPGYSPNAS